MAESLILHNWAKLGTKSLVKELNRYMYKKQEHNKLDVLSNRKKQTWDPVEI